MQNRLAEIAVALRGVRETEEAYEWHDRPAPRAAAKKKIERLWDRISELSKESLHGQ